MSSPVKKKSRRKRKLFYTIQGWGGVGVWVRNGKWSTSTEAPCSNIKTTHRMDVAIRHASRIEKAGGTPMITQYFYKRGVRWARQWFWRVG